MPTNKNHHYIPQSYMKFFSEDGKNVSIYNHYCPVKILDLEINRVDHHPLGR